MSWGANATMDDIDRAQEREQLDRAFALAAQEMRLRPPTPADGRCVDCGAVIEPERLRALGATNVCAACAQERAAYEMQLRGRQRA